MSNSIEFKHKNDTDSSGFLLWQVTMLWQRKIKKELDKLGITHTQFVLLASLAWLSKTNKNVTQIDIANQSKTDRMMVSKVLRTLEEKGFLSRQEHETDTRAKTITLSKEGKVLLQKAIKNVEQVDTEFFSVLTTQANGFNRNLVTLISKNL
ncbi:MAG: MarR family transcriptional regulator [Bacteroidetes bacterium B1(2017)]|nr:MAG: MarR family transcriptional regulator [Bacteroidetes bacterium B1(2017)]